MAAHSSKGGPFGKENNMTVMELIEKLQELRPHVVVVMASDSEGNRVRPCESLSVGVYDQKDKELYSGKKDLARGPLAVCLWPAH